MYDITKTRMLLTTVVFAAVAALFAAGANARIPADTGSAFAAQESLRIGAYASQPPSWRGKGGKGEETEGATNPLQRTGVARRDNQLDTAIGTAMATQAARTRDRESGTLGGEQQVPQASGRTAANDAAHFPDTSDVVSRYLGNDRMDTSPFPDGYRGRP